MDRDNLLRENDAHTKKYSNMDIETALAMIGFFGKWHIWTYFWISILVMVQTMLGTCIIFMQFIPQFQCDNELFLSTNWTFEQIQKIRLTWDLVCSDAVHVANAQAVFVIGYTVSCVTSGFLADRFGRKRCVIVFGLLCSIFGIVNAWLTNFYAFLSIRMLIGYFTLATENALYILSLELCNQKLRRPVAALYFISSGIGYALLANVAYLVQSWNWMQTVVAIPQLCLVLYIWFIPESPRYLLSKGRVKEAEDILLKAASWNKVVLPQEFSLQITTKLVDVKSDTILSIFKHRILTIRAFVIFFLWLVNTLVYYGISLSVTSFSGDIFLNNALSGLVEIPAYILCLPLLSWGRKNGIISSLVIVGCAQLIYLATSNNMPWLQMTVAMFGKLFITASFNIMMAYTSELYPTTIRGAAVNLSSLVGRIGTISAPYIALIAQTRKDLHFVPSIIFGSASLLAAILTLALPETKDKSLPETLNDVLAYRAFERKTCKNVETMLIDVDNEKIVL